MREHRPSPLPRSRNTRRDSIRVTRQQIQRPRTDEEFLEEYEQYSASEQARRLSLVGNISRDEFEKRLSLLGHHHDEILQLAEQRERPDYERFIDSEIVQTVYVEVDHIQEDQQNIQEDIYPPPDMAQPLPEWVENILKSNAEAQKTMAAALERLSITGGKQSPPRPLRHEEVYDFKPSDSPEDIEYFLFKERISDLVGQYGDDRVRPALLACLQNARARQ